MENVHSEMYSLLLDHYVRDPAVSDAENKLDRHHIRHQPHGGAVADRCV